MLSQTLTAFHDAVSLLLRGQVERRNVLEGLDLVLLAAVETVDDGYVFCYSSLPCSLSRFFLFLRVWYIEGVRAETRETPTLTL